MAPTFREKYEERLAEATKHPIGALLEEEKAHVGLMYLGQPVNPHPKDKEKTMGNSFGDNFDDARRAQLASAQNAYSPPPAPPPSDGHLAVALTRLGIVEKVLRKHQGRLTEINNKVFGPTHEPAPASKLGMDPMALDGALPRLHATFEIIEGLLDETNMNIGRLEGLA